MVNITDINEMNRRKIKTRAKLNAVSEDERLEVLKEHFKYLRGNPLKSLTNGLKNNKWPT